MFNYKCVDATQIFFYSSCKMDLLHSLSSLSLSLIILSLISTDFLDQPKLVELASEPASATVRGLEGTGSNPSQRQYAFVSLLKINVSTRPGGISISDGFSAKCLFQSCHSPSRLPKWDGLISWHL